METITISKEEFEKMKNRLIELEKIEKSRKEESLRKLNEIFGSSKHKTTDDDIHKAREKAFDELDKELD